MSSARSRSLVTLLLLLASSVIFHLARTAGASSYRLPEDHVIAAWEARTGTSLWTYRPEKLSFAEFEVRPSLLTVTPHVGYAAHPELNLDPRTGRRVPQVPPVTIRSIPLASAGNYPWPVATLANGWTLSEFHPGQGEPLVFRDRARIRWVLHVTPAPDAVTAWRNSIIAASGETLDDAMVRSYPAGQVKPSCTFRPQQVLSATEPIRAHLAILASGDDLYVCLREHLFLLDPVSAAVRNHWNLTEVTGIAWQGEGKGFFRGGTGAPILAADERTLIVCFEGHVLALDREHWSLLWHRDPELGSRPVPQYPLLHGGVLYLTVGTPAPALP